MEELLKRLPEGTKLLLLFDYNKLKDKETVEVEVVVADERSLFVRDTQNFHWNTPWNLPEYSVQLCDWGFAILRKDKGAYIYEFIEEGN